MGAAFGARTNVYRPQEGAKFEIYHRPIALHHKIAQFPWRYNFIHSAVFRTWSYIALTFMTGVALMDYKRKTPEYKKQMRQLEKDKDRSPFAPIRPPKLPKVEEC